MNNEKNNNVKNKGILVIAITVIGIIVLYNVSAILGVIIYLVAFAASLKELKGKVAFDATFSIQSFLKNINKNSFWEEGVFTIIVALIPIIICSGIWQWLFADTLREVNMFYK